MEESLQCSHNLPSNAQPVRVSIPVRALVHGWRHTGRSLVGVDIVEAAALVAEASWRSSSTTPEPPAQPGQRQRVGGQLRLAALRVTPPSSVAAR